MEQEDDTLESMVEEICNYYILGPTTALVRFALNAVNSCKYSDEETPFTLEDLREMLPPRCPKCGTSDLSCEDTNNSFVCNSCGTSFFNEQDPAEFAWWHVSKRLAEDLQRNGEPILADGDAYYWGRSSAWRPLKQEPVIRLIAQNRLDILKD